MATADRTFDILIQGNAASALAAFKSTQLAALKTKAVTGGALVKMGAVTAGAAIVGAGGLFKLGESFDKVRDKIRITTGATGKQLEGLMGNFKNIARNSSADFATITDAMTQVNRRLGQTGKPLEDLTRQFIFLDKRGMAPMATTIPAVTRLFGDWGVQMNQQVPTMDKLFRASQQTGIGVDRLSELMVQFGSPLRALGLDFNTTAAMFAKFEKEGVNIETALPGLRMALKNFAQAGREPRQALLDTIDAIKSAKTPLDAMKIGFEVFGRRAGPDMAMAIREGRLDLDDLIKSISSGKDTIFKAGKETKSFSQTWSQLKNRVFVALEPIATRLFDAIGKGLEIMTNPRWSSSIMILVGAFTALAVGIKVVSIAMAILSANPIVLLISGLILAGVAVYTFRAQIVGAFQAVVEWLKNNWPKIVMIIGGPIGVVVVAIVQHWETIRGAFTRGFQAVIDTVSNAIGWIRTNWPLIVAILTGPIGLAVLGIIRHWETIKSGVRSAVDWVKRTVSAGFTAVRDTGVALFRGLRDGIGRVWSTVKDKVRGPINSVIRFINTLIRGINKVLDLIPGLKDVNIPTISTLAAGGTVGSGAAALASGAKAVHGMARGGMIDLRRSGPFITKGPAAVVGEGRTSHPEFVIPTDPSHRSRARMLYDQLGHVLQVPGMQFGGIIGGLKDAFGKGVGFIKGAIGGIGGLARKALTSLFDPIAKSVINSLGGLPNLLYIPRIAKGIAQALWDWVKGADTGLPAAPRYAHGALPRGKGIAGLREPVASMATETLRRGGGSVFIVSGWRSSAQQAVLYQRWLAGVPGQARAAPPGTSKHERGLAVDWGGVRSVYQPIWRSLRGHFPVPGEPWHGEAIGYRMGGIVGNRGGFVHSGEAVLTQADQVGFMKLVRTRGGGTVINVQPGAVVVQMPAGATEDQARRLGGAAAKGFMDVLAQRRVMTDARISSGRP